MSNSNRSLRVRTKVGKDKYVNVDLSQDYDIIELLSLKIGKENAYKFHTAHYGCIAGRVIANGGVGVPNAKVSLFIKSDIDNDSAVIRELYPYSSVFTKNNDGMEYNTLPEEEVDECHTPVGSMPSKRMVLDDNTILEVFDKYYKFTTRTNDAGDYMLFGIPTGEQTIHVDIDLSDIGFLSQKPYDMIYKGYDINMFDSPKKFKSGNNLKNLPQLINQTDSVDIFPFWGEDETGNGTDEYSNVKITRHDISLSYKIEPTCVFMGSMVTDTKGQGFSRKCIPSKEMGKMNRLVTGAGTIEMIRKKTDGSVEEIQIEGNELIDADGTWCYQIPMNLDYIATDEYGNIVPTDNPEKGIPTRTRVRFRVSLTDYESDYGDNHLVKMLIPNNPKEYEELDYNFGSYTLDNEEGSASFRDLFWNNVYTVKSYIPRIQKSTNQDNAKFSGFKDVNVYGSNSPIPYNNLRMKMTFMFVLQCCMARIILWVIKIVNGLLSFIINWKLRALGITLFTLWKKGTCIFFGDGICPDLEGWFFAPGCDEKKNEEVPWKNTFNKVKGNFEGDETSIDYQNHLKGEKVCLTNSWDYLVNCVEINLAQEYNLIHFDFYNDWINGLLYIPRWFNRIKKKKTYKVGSIRSDGAMEACGDDSSNVDNYMKIMQQCVVKYSYNDEDGAFNKIESPNGCGTKKILGIKTGDQRCHKGKGKQWVRVCRRNDGTIKNGGGLIHQNETLNNTNVFYIKPCEWDNDTRKVLFSTDIVLLGSLNNDGMYGIPSYFKDIDVTTYMMPSNLASTNMDEDGYMYGIDGASVCNNKAITRPMEIIEDTFDNFEIWAKNKEYYSVDSGITGYAVTEMAGVDWGYSGPGQGSNDFDKLYFPGGHFLGISCLNSQVNIKSCVNLSRACELGVEFSQRHAILRKNEANNQVLLSYTIPTGIISKDEISESDYRGIFATLNYNGLKTVRNKNTNYREYEFIACKPKRFAGEFNDKVKDNELYNSKTAIAEPYGATGSGIEHKAYKRTYERYDKEYYYFRLGLDLDANKSDIQRKYLIKSGGAVAMPVYENSFYFYFGLNNGNTALNRFLGDFSGKCDSIEKNIEKYRIVVKNNSFCASKDTDENADGSIDITFNGVESPYSITVSKEDKTLYIDTTDGKEVVRISEQKGKNGYEEIIFNNSEIKIDKVPVGEYKITLSSTDGITNTRTVKVGFDYPESTIKADIGCINFIRNVTNKIPSEVIEESDGGSVSVELHIADDNIKGYIITNDESYLKITNSDYDYVEENGTLLAGKENIGGSKRYTFSEDDSYNSFRQNVWKGNDTYYVYALYYCDNVKKIYPVFLDNVRVTMPIPVDVYLGDEDVLYNQHILTYMNMEHPTEKKSNWYRKFLEKYSNITKNQTIKKDKTFLVITPKMVWNVKHSLYYRNSAFLLDGFERPIGITGGTPPYETYVIGTGDRIDISEESNNEILKHTSCEELYSNKDLPNGFTINTTGTTKLVSNDYTLDYRMSYIPTKGLYIPHKKSDKNNTNEYNYNGVDYGTIIKGSKKDYVYLTGLKNDTGVYVVDKNNNTTVPTVFNSKNINIVGKDDGGVNFGIFKFDNFEKTPKTEQATTWEGDCFVKLPTFYKPFYMCCTVVIDANNKTHIGTHVVNPIPLGGKCGNYTVKVNNRIVEDKSLTLNDSIVNWSDVASFGKELVEYTDGNYKPTTKDILSIETFDNTELSNGEITINLTYDEESPENYSGEINPRSSELYHKNMFYMNTKGTTSTNARYFLVKKNYNDSVITDLLKFKEDFRSVASVYYKPEDIEEVETKKIIDASFSGSIDDSGATENVAFDDICGCLSGATGSNYVIGVSDVFVNALVTKEKDGTTITQYIELNEMYDNFYRDLYTKDTDRISIFKIYKGDEFKKIMRAVFEHRL